MTFTSLAWLAIMVGTISIYWIVPERIRDHFIALVTLVFLLVIDTGSAAILLAFSVFAYFFSERVKSRVATTALSTLVIIGILAYFKVRVSNAPFDVIRDVAMPLGLSYYSFRLIHYLLDKYRGAVPKHGFVDFFCYLFFLPTLLVGPINRFQEFFSDRQRKTWNAANLSEGMERILFGYFKIVVVGNLLLSKHAALQIGQIDPENKALIFYLEAVRGSLNLYMQFSGYSDVAIGFALMLGYRVRENFNWPFLKKNIAEFWRAWHMSLTTWSRDYVYMTAVGMTRNPWFGTLASLIVIGIWHELSLRYVIWGVYHAVGIITVNQLQKRRRGRSREVTAVSATTRVTDAVKIFATANYFFFGYIIINQPSLQETLVVYRTIFVDWWL